MPRRGQQVVRDDEGGLADRISVGVLARAFPRELVEPVIDTARSRLGPTSIQSLFDENSPSSCFRYLGYQIDRFRQVEVLAPGRGAATLPNGVAGGAA